jgi:hypothetical protein
MDNQSVQYISDADADSDVDWGGVGLQY